MIRSLRLARLLISSLLALAASSVMAAPVDVKGGHDHPLIQRFTGSWMIGYMQRDFDQTEFPTSGAIKDDKWAAPVAAEGRLTRIYYLSPKGKAPLEVFRNYQQALVAAGFKPRYVCEKNCTDVYYAMSKTIDPSKGPTWATGGLEDIGGGNYSIDGGILNAFQGRFWYGTLPRDGQDIHVLVYTSMAENEESNIASTLIQIIEPKAMQTGQVKVDAKALEKGLQADGKILLYGLYFDTGKADVKPESQPQLAEMAKFLQAQPALKVYIVGHTDNQGSLDSNTTLSQQRAQAVVASLVKDFKVDPKRLVARGVASLAPVSTNATDAGRAKNRRVELVAQ